MREKRAGNGNTKEKVKDEKGSSEHRKGVQYWSGDTIKVMSGSAAGRHGAMHVLSDNMGSKQKVERGKRKMRKQERRSRKNDPDITADRKTTRQKGDL